MFFAPQAPFLADLKVGTTFLADLKVGTTFLADLKVGTTFLADLKVGTTVEAVFDRDFRSADLQVGRLFSSASSPDSKLFFSRGKSCIRSDSSLTYRCFDVSVRPTKQIAVASTPSSRQAARYSSWGWGPTRT
jgi:hypothetical protein